MRVGEGRIIGRGKAVDKAYLQYANWSPGFWIIN